MYPSLYLEDAKEFNSLGEGILKATQSCYVVHERNGQFDLELEYLADSRLSNNLIKGKIIKADAGKRFTGQLFRIYKVNKTLENIVKVYAYHISYDLKYNPVSRINLENVSCINALNSIKNSAILPFDFNFSTDITHTSNFNAEGKTALECLGGTEGSIIDNYGNGANIVRDNFNIKIMQNAGFDNNVLISYKKNLLSLDHDDEELQITGVYPFAKEENGIDESNSTISSFLELPEKVIYREDYKDFKVQNVVPVDFSGKGISTMDSLRTNAISHLKAIISDNISIKVDFLDKTKLDDYEGISSLQNLDVHDKVIVRYLKLDVNYKSSISKVKYNVLTEKYEEIEIGQTRTNLANTITDTDSFIKDEIDKNTNFWQQAIEHATSQITGNSGGYVKMFPPNKPSEIFIMDADDANLAVNVLRMNKQGIGFSKNGINGPFETAWTADGTFYADWITAGTLNANLIRAGILQNIDGSLQIDLGSSNGIMTRKNGKNAIELIGPNMKFYDWDGEGTNIGQIFSSRMDGNQAMPGLAIANKLNSFLAFSYEKNNTFYPYVLFDKNNIYSNANSPVAIFEETEFRGSQLWFGHEINSIYNSVDNHFVNKVKNIFYIRDNDTGISRLLLNKNALNLYDPTDSGNRYCLISPSQTFFGGGGQKYFEARQNGFSFWKGSDDILYTTTADTIQSDRGVHINGNFTVNGNKNCVQTTRNYGDRLFYSVEDCESYLTDRSMELFNVEEIVTDGIVTYERVVLLDNIFKESVNLDLGYTIEVIKQGWGDYRIKEQCTDYFIVESDRPDFTFKYVVTGKRAGFENERNKEIFLGVKDETKETIEYWRLYSNTNPVES